MIVDLSDEDVELVQMCIALGLSEMLTKLTRPAANEKWDQLIELGRNFGMEL